MKFKIKTGRGFGNEGKIYTAPVIARKLNGFKVKVDDNSVAFICTDDIEIIEISEQEKAIPIEW